MRKSEVVNKGVYLAIIVSLLAHVAVLFVLNFIAVGGGDSEEASDSGEQMIDLDFVELEATEAVGEEASIEEEKINSLIADANSEYISEKISHHAESEIEQDVYNELKELEQQFFKDAQANHVKNDVTDYEGEVLDTEELEKYDYLGKSYEGAVSATFSLAGRDAVSRPVPTYKCKTSGTVTINITVNQKGEVQTADVNPSQSTTLNECLLSEARIYAQRWKFDSSYSYSKKQEGSIVFKFQAQ